MDSCVSCSTDTDFRMTCSKKNTAFYKLCAAARLPHWLPYIRESKHIHVLGLWGQNDGNPNPSFMGGGLVYDPPSINFITNIQYWITSLLINLPFSFGPYFSFRHFRFLQKRFCAKWGHVIFMILGVENRSAIRPSLYVQITLTELATVECHYILNLWTANIITPKIRTPCGQFFRSLQYLNCTKFTWYYEHSHASHARSSTTADQFNNYTLLGWAWVSPTLVSWTLFFHKLYYYLLYVVPYILDAVI